MENDNETYGDGNSLDYGARIYDSRLGRWLSVDPSESLYPGISTYNFSLNCPSIINDPDGKGGRITIEKNPNGGGKMVMETTVFLYGQNQQILENTANQLNEVYGKMDNVKNVKDVNGNCWEVTIKVHYVAAPQVTTDMVSNLPSNGLTPDANMLPQKVKQNIGFNDGDNLIKINSSSIGSTHGYGQKGGNYAEATTSPSVILEETFHLFGFGEHYIFSADMFDKDMKGSVMATGGPTIDPTYIDNVFFYRAADYWKVLSNPKNVFDKMANPFVNKALEDTGDGAYIVDKDHSYRNEKLKAAQSVDVEPCCD